MYPNQRGLTKESSWLVLPDNNDGNFISVYLHSRTEFLQIVSSDWLDGE